MSLNKLAKEIHKDNIKKGFYDIPISDIEACMLIVSEISEAVEEICDGALDYYHNIDGKPEGRDAELADALIRILDRMAYLEIDIDDVVKDKLAYNRTRPYKHGKKL